MKGWPAAFLLALCTALATAQTTPGSWALQGAVDLFTTDELGNLYVLRGSDLDLYDRQGKLVAHNSLNAFGTITGIDAFYSLKPMIFSGPQATLAVLDNTLSLQGAPTNLARAGFPQATLACSSVQNNFWLFDERDMALVRVDGRLNQVANSGRLDQLLSFSPHPTYMEEADGRLYLVDPRHGVLTFDLFGTFMRTLPILGADRVQVREGTVWYVSGGRLHRYDPATFSALEPDVPRLQQETLDARIEQDRLYRLTPSGLVVDPLGQ